MFIVFTLGHGEKNNLTAHVTILLIAGQELLITYQYHDMRIYFVLEFGYLNIVSLVFLVLKDCITVK